MKGRSRADGDRGAEPGVPRAGDHLLLHRLGFYGEHGTAACVRRDRRAFGTPIQGGVWPQAHRRDRSSTHPIGTVARPAGRSLTAKRRDIGQETQASPNRQNRFAVGRDSGLHGHDLERIPICAAGQHGYNQAGSGCRCIEHFQRRHKANRTAPAGCNSGGPAFSGGAGPRLSHQKGAGDRESGIGFRTTQHAKVGDGIPVFSRSAAV